MRRQYVLTLLGVLVCLTGALLMVAGESILGADHAGIATVVGIVGIGIMGSSGASIAGVRA